jgi:hypothetical protein
LKSTLGGNIVELADAKKSIEEMQQEIANFGRSL